MRRPRQIARTLRNQLFPKRTPPPGLVNSIDAPVLTAVAAEIPTGDGTLFAPSFVSRRDAEEMREIRLGPAELRGDNGWIYQNGIWLMGFTWFGGQSFLPPSYQISPSTMEGRPLSKALDGPVTSTLCDFSGVYGHVLLDELPKLLYLLDSGRFEAFDTILSSSLAVKLLGRIADPRKEALLARITVADHGLRYLCADFTVLQRSGCRMNPSPQEIALLRRYGLAGAGEAAKEAYPLAMFLDRASKTRAIENADAVRASFARLGIEVVLATGFKAPWRAFAEARLIVGVAGSDLSDSVFMSPGAVLVEIHPSDHIKPYNWNVAAKIGVEYRSIVARSTVERGTLIGPGNSPVTIDIAALEAALSGLAETSAAPRVSTGGIR